MARLVIHIGLHKTASTFVQRSVFGHAQLLQSAGVAVPMIGSRPDQHGFAGVWNPVFREQDGDPRELWKTLARDWAGFDGTVFLSSEELSRFGGKPATDFAELRSLTRAFEAVRVICVLRNQASFLQAAYQEVARKRVPKPWSAIMETALSAAIFDGLTLDFEQLYDRLSEGFSANEMCFLSYDALSDRPEGILGAIFAELGCAECLLQMPRLRRVNVSAPPLATWLANRRAAPNLASKELLRLAEQQLRARLGRKQRQTLFCRHELAEISARFEESNRRFAARIAPMQPGFSVGPMLPQGADIWRDDVPEDLLNLRTQPTE